LVIGIWDLFVIWDLLFGILLRLRMRLFNKITIIGVGLIGGSIGLAVKKRKVAGEVVGVFRHADTMQRARKARAIDTATMDMLEGVKDADLVVIATPVSMIPCIVEAIAPVMRKGSIITDAGSAKGFVVREASKALSNGVKFVGSHPMAGSEKTGVNFASADLFKGATSIVTRTRYTDKAALLKIKRFWESLGSKVMVMDPDEHDRAVALVSHLPHLLAQELCLLQDKKSIACAAGGFKDTTRIAASDPMMWLDIFQANKKEVARAIDDMVNLLKHFKKAVESGDSKSIAARGARAKAIREELN
jgi:prephenate dehydrogenase